MDIRFEDDSKEWNKFSSKFNQMNRHLLNKDGENILDDVNLKDRVVVEKDKNDALNRARADSALKNIPFEESEDYEDSEEIDNQIIDKAIDKFFEDMI